MLPEIAELEFNQEQTETTTMGKSFLFDFAKGDFVIKNGRMVKVEGIEALKVWIEKIIRTEKLRFKAYKRTSGDEYGVTIEDLIVGHELPQEFIESELQREITEALTKHPEIDSVSNFTILKENPLIKISFKVNLVNGNTFGQEVNL